MRLLKIDHVCLNVDDVPAAARRYSLQFGLAIREATADRATLACDYEPYSLELVRDGAAPLGFAHCAWQLRRSASLDGARTHLDGAGADWDDGPDTLVVRDPEGFEHHIVPHRDEGDARPAIARRTATLGPLRPRKLGHI